ncbi:hypothetical protein XarbCFBP7408_20795 [Xanthomonas arboricola pv. guizotiae]|uniref:Thioredoxin domain-containing protein n=1 Tax=Xanthomonas arboricola pv. guizotiae TaxID=487867 RepID=A0A2S6ZNS9_9XANT|nr:hypothetical protein XarbCFBP7409_20165 [Xanthomonas arboricola pv. guizotiae]PPU17972.1 hypothetical protein XarbCFBP7408_20795 [Xanthomonas arboricola pv. guizotiae]
MPGDRAPALRFARVFNGGQPVEQVTFDRLTAVILWNAGCAGCLPAVAEVAAIAADYVMPVYGVAVMVRDVDRTAQTALQGRSRAVLALEERPTAEIGLMRGSVTRNWLEASGIPGVPAAYLVNGAGRIAWIGDPTEIAGVLPELAAGSWDVAAARERWRATASDEEVAQLRLTRDVMDTLIAGQIQTARELVAAGERNLPSLNSDAEFAILKFQALAAAPAEVDQAVTHYRAAAARFPADLRLQTMLGGAALTQLGSEPEALWLVLQAMAGISDGPAESLGEQQSRIQCRLLEAEAAARLNRPEDAVVALERAAVLSGSAVLPERAKAWATREIERVRKLLSPKRQDSQTMRE